MYFTNTQIHKSGFAYLYFNKMFNSNICLNSKNILFKRDNIYLIMNCNACCFIIYLPNQYTRFYFVFKYNIFAS